MPNGDERSALSASPPATAGAVGGGGFTVLERPPNGGGGGGGAGVTEPDRTDTEFNQLYGYAPAVGPQPITTDSLCYPFICHSLIEGT